MAHVVETRGLESIDFGAPPAMTGAHRLVKSGSRRGWPHTGQRLRERLGSPDTKRHSRIESFVCGLIEVI
jgi:hypothetical protein